jgi:hypothetical protein
MSRKKKEEIAEAILTDAGVEDTSSVIAGPLEVEETRETEVEHRPSGYLLTYSAFRRLCPGLSEKTVRRLSDAGKFPPYVRLSPQGTAYWNGKAVMEHFEKTYAPLGGLESVISVPKKSKWFDPLGSEGPPNVGGDD